MRARYLLVAVSLSILFVASVWLTHVLITSAIKETAGNSIDRHQVVNRHRVVREQLRQAEYAIQAYLVSPEKQEYERVLTSIDRVIMHLQGIADNPWLRNSQQELSIKQLIYELIEFKRVSKLLLNTRLDTRLLFPALKTIDEVMYPQNVAFKSYIKLSVNELASRLNEPKIQAAYHQFYQLREDWGDMVSVFRMYMASKAMDLNEQSLDASHHEQAIEIYIDQIRRQLDDLQRLQGRYDLGLQANEALTQLTGIVDTWYQAYLSTRAIYASDKWRMDESLMSQEVQPINGRIWQHLNQIELALEASSREDVAHLAKVSSNVGSMLWLRMLIALLFMVVVFFAFEHWILRPVARIAHALKAEAEGNAVEALPEANSLEARELVEAFAEMRSQVRARQMELEYQTLHDHLTNLPNRLYLRKQLISNIEEARNRHCQLALLMIDLDRFKEINDTLGHHMGDRVLREIGPRFNQVLGGRDILARLGGDEFAVLLPDCCIEKANEVAKSLSRTLDKEFHIEGQHLHVGSSIGVALFPQHGEDEHALMQRADVAMYLAKHKNIRYAVYDEDQDEHSLWQLSFEVELHKAIADNQLELHYQPKVDLKTGQMTGVEALLRWHHPRFGLIPADEMHLLAEKTGLIKPLSKWVIGVIIEQLSNWQEQQLDIDVSANLSVWNLLDTKLCDFIEHELKQYQVPANKLILEINESSVMSDPERAIETMNHLAKLGVGLSIDDFGTGFSSLQYLKKMPVNELKIDKSFVMDMFDDENDAIIVRSTIDLAHNLGLKVVAEGVESREIYDILEILRCDKAQGFYMGKAMPAEQLQLWIQASNWGPQEHAVLELLRS